MVLIKEKKGVGLHSSKNGSTKKFSIYDLKNYLQMPQIDKLSEDQKLAIEVVGRALPFRTNPYVVNELINWDNVPDDPMFVLTFPQKNMLKPHHFNRIASLLRQGADQATVDRTANQIRMELNPQPAGQLDHNVPTMDGEKLDGMQHKYRETILFFPSQGQTCHAYCSFCFRWPQFVGMDELKFATRKSELLVKYLRKNPQISDVLFTGGDPMIMTAKNLSAYIDTLLDAELPNLKTIRLGTKSLSYWPYKYLIGKEADEVLRLFDRVAKAGKHLAIMAHFNHPNELQTEAVAQAIERIRNTGAQIRTQSPILRHINDSAAAWATMWRKQVDLGLIPYYMFVVRDTGAQHYFGVPLVRAWRIYQDAYKRVSGICRTVRGPSMSAGPGKVQIMGISTVNDEKIITCRFLQGRNPDWVLKPFFAKYNPKAIWLDDLQPAFGEDQFFFEEELQQLYEEDRPSGQIDIANVFSPEEIA